MKKLFLFLLVTTMSYCAFAQTIEVTGKITDSATGESIPLAGIQIKGKSTGSSSDIDGFYRINAASNDVLMVSSLGYKTQEIEINGRKVINVALDEDAQTLDDVLIVAFGKSTKEAFTGSAKVLGDEKISLSQVTDVTSALAGQVAGVQLVASNGAPGSSPTIRIHGIGSVNAGKDPLIIVDGAPFDGDMNNIAPSDIESMTVLKDAASNALYGARGANGVIMITTKNPKKGGSNVTLDAKFGVNTNALRAYNTINDPRGYYEQHYKAMYNYYVAADGLNLSPAEAHMRANENIANAENGGLGYQIFSGVPQGQTLIGVNGKINPNATLGNVIGGYMVKPDNWADNAYRNGTRNEYTFTVSGSEGKMNYYSSLSYLNNEGITEKSDLTRLSARLKADYQAKKWLKTGVNMAYTNFESNALSNNGNDSSTANIWAYTSQIAPIYPLWVRNADGSIYVDENGIKLMDHGNGLLIQGGIPGTVRPFITNANPLLATRLNTNNNEGNAINVQGYADFNLTKYLTFTINATTYVDETRTKYVYNPYYGQFRTTGGTIDLYHTRLYTYNTQQLLNFNKSFGEHNVSVLLGHEYYNREYSLLGAGKSKMFSQENTELDGAVVDGQQATSYKTFYNNEGYFVRAQYDLAEKVFASLSFRRDASSKFHPDNRWGNFWSAGAAWIISKEDWFDASWVNMLKVKTSYGSQGNDNIGSYRYTDVFDIVPSDGNVSTIFSTKGNKDITWETNTNFNAGVEFGLLNDRISGNIDFFNRKTTDMLFSTPVAPSQGYSSIYKNVGDMSNYGIEADLNVVIMNTKTFQWSVNGNISYLKNKIVSLDESVKQSSAYDKDGNEYKGFKSGGFFVTEDKSMYTWYRYEFAGVDPTTGKSLWYKNVTDSDGNVTGRETTDDYSKATQYVTDKTTLAPFFGGFGTALNYRGIDLAINFTFQIGGTQYDATYATLMYSPTASQTGYAYHADLLDSWTPENTSSDIPRFQMGDSYANAQSTRFLTSASYLNLQNINLGYTLPRSLTQKAGINSIRLYAAAENLFYWSARKGFDPRQSYDSSSSAANYSPMRTVSGGITFNF
ncbi:MAG: SusC/RagA family TonB-linked outer membrane protein [Bacteroidaceae bacterium]|nr:SusC/RagA family TonB-linked outer membrane protein [Bacteroidaceae bacterium]